MSRSAVGSACSLTLHLGVSGSALAGLVCDSPHRKTRPTVTADAVDRRPLAPDLPTPDHLPLWSREPVLRKAITFIVAASAPGSPPAVAAHRHLPHIRA